MIKKPKKGCFTTELRQRLTASTISSIVPSGQPLSGLRPGNPKHLVLTLGRDLSRPESISSAMKSHLPLLILLHVRTTERVVKDLASFLQQVSTIIQIYRKTIQRTNLQPLPLKHSNLPQRPIPIPKLLPRQPDRPLLRLLPQRHSKQRSVTRYQQFQWRTADLV
jgi:hypothetical protein